MLNTIREGLRSLAPLMWQATGREKETGEPLSVIYAGPETQLNFMMGKLFSGDVERRALGRHLFTSINALLEKEKCSFAVIAGSCQFIAPLRHKNDLCVPWWINSRLDLDVTLGPGKKSSLADDLRKVRKHELRLVESNQDEAFDHFFDEIYYPTVVASHGDAGLPSDKEKRRQQLRNGSAELLLVKQGEETLAGVLLDYRGPLPTLREIGILGGDRNLMKLGIITGANFFAFQHLKNKGFKDASLGLSRCFLNDGVLNYKRKWQPIFEHPTEDCFLFRVRQLDDATRAFFVHNPCITEMDKQLYRTRFSSGPSKASVGSIVDLGGVDGTLVYDLSGSALQLAV